jgi:hypothetical protein
VIATDGGAFGTASSAAVTAIATGIMALWGIKRRLYTITVSAEIGETLDWGSVVRVFGDYDVLQSGPLGQIVGWAYKTDDSTAAFQVLV